MGLTLRFLWLLVRGKCALAGYRVLLGAIFIYASIHKIQEPYEFARIVHGYRLLPPELVNLVAITLPWIEVVTGAFLILGLFTRESALIIRPDVPWPGELPAGSRQLLVEGPNALRAPIREAYTLDRITPQPDGTVRLDLANSPPLVVSWHQVTEMDPQRPGFFRTNRPLLAGSCTPWLWGMRAWFPRLDKTFTFEKLTGGFHTSTEGVMHEVNLAAAGVQPGDWFVVHFVQPGMTVTLPATRSWTAH